MSLSVACLQSLESRAVKMLPRYMFKRIETSPGEFKVPTAPLRTLDSRLRT